MINNVDKIEIQNKCLMNISFLILTPDLFYDFLKEHYDF